MHKNPSSKMNVAVVGGSGYSGLELQRLLNKHPHVASVTAFNSQTTANMKVSDYQVVFLATPAEVSMELVPAILKEGSKVIDLSGAFRLSQGDVLENYKTWYEMDHKAQNFLLEAHYGLVPWNNAKKEVSLIANPGCYATAVLMGLLPLLSLGLIDEKSIVIDAKSGATGAGKKASESMLFCEVEGECLPYKIGEHQHLPEIQQYAQSLGGQEIDPFFATSLLNTRRGIIAGIYANLNPQKNAQDVANAFKEFYAHYPLVEVAEEITREMVSLKAVVGTAKTRIAYKIVGTKIYLYSSIDNLLKGAASQAVENFNLMNQFPVTTGLDHLETMV
jgi:N-acetyl-gamma-glutamyl-phosphate reductase